MDYLNGGAWHLAGEFTDRLSRNLVFIAALMESGVEFVAIDNPTASRLTLHILAAVAEHERAMISERTKAALQAAKARGVKLGSPDPVGTVSRMVVARRASAERFAANVLPIIQATQRAGAASNAATAAELNARKMPTARGREWTHVQVGAILARASGSQIRPSRLITYRLAQGGHRGFGDDAGV